MSARCSSSVIVELSPVVPHTISADMPPSSWRSIRRANDLKSAFPSENATGNFVKIVQRVPVKIVIDKGLDPNKPLPLGLSVEPKVTVE